MKQIRIKCYFTESEWYISHLLIRSGIKVKVRKIIDPIAMMPNIILGNDEYDIFGNDDEVDKFIKELNSNGWDIDILD